MAEGRQIRKILIPNRGEIAVRIQRTCRELNIPSVAVFSEPDRNALHVRYADEAYPLPGNTPAETYLNQDRIFEVARVCGADAIHPGYGFLSENAEFARRCRENDIIFIGPPPEAIELMGLKTEARYHMSQAGVPVIPGTEPLDNLEICRQKAEEIGYPVLIKAVAGGGGKGMRTVATPEALERAYGSAGREAKSAFGDQRVYIEKYLSKPRHIEFQILADLHGNVVHLYERECSVQRRHQKIIEETPSPILDEEMRSRMGAVAIEAARACQYTNAGTVEFLVDERRNFYFLEMNTRLQVEHPITEMITGIDIVKQQIHITQGGKISPDPVSRQGAALECRIYAEDPTRNFLPSPGLIKGLTDPGGPGVRNDSGVYSGYTIPVEYDPMISKLVTWGIDRNQALNRMLRALEEFRLLGIRTNISYLRRILQHPHFQSGDYDTLFIENFQQELLRSTGKGDETIALSAAGVLNLINGKKTGTVSRDEGKKLSPWKYSNRTWKVPR
jgi:acetyl-CoA carboxylase biotin carboxylase subunit